MNQYYKVISGPEHNGAWFAAYSR